MKISHEIAERTATAFGKKKGYGSYACCGATFSERISGRTDLPFLTPSPPSWIVRFQNPTQRKDVIIDDGDMMICIAIDANTGAPSLLKGI